MLLILALSFYRAMHYAGSGQNDTHTQDDYCMPRGSAHRGIPTCKMTLLDQQTVGARSQVNVAHMD